MQYSWSRLSLLLLAGLVFSSCAEGSGGNGILTDGGPFETDGGTVDASDQPDASSLLCTDSTCFPGVTCTEGDSAPSCGVCPSGTDGDGFQCDDVDACVASPCADNVVCTDQVAPLTGFDCGECPKGLNGNGIICTDIDSCSGSPCFATVTCTDLPPPEVGFSCGTCPAGFEGDGLSCNDIDGCAGSPCFPGVTCNDVQAPQTGFTCDPCPAGLEGDGITCQAACDPVLAANCGTPIASSNTAMGSADVVDDWACTVVTLAGSEIVYTFVPDGTGIATASLTGLSADLDLLVIKESASPGQCDATDNTVCIPNGYSGNIGTNSELVRWDAVAGETYYIIVDAFQSSTSNFTLEVSTSIDDVLLTEIGYGIDDFVEITNFGACTLDFSGLSLMHRASLDATATNFTFPTNTNVGPQTLLRWIESTSNPFLANEISSGFNIPDLPSDAGFTALCDGTCNTMTCVNLLDYVERNDSSDPTDLPGGPACANFSPGPVDAVGQSGEVSLNRAAFAGAASANDFQAADWAFGATSRN